MNEILDFMATHWGILMAAGSAVGVLVIAIVKATPTKKDDKILKDIQDAKSYLRNYREDK